LVDGDDPTATRRSAAQWRRRMSHNFDDGMARAAAALFDSLTPEGVEAYVERALAEAVTWRDLAELLTADQAAVMEYLNGYRRHDNDEKHDELMLATARLCVERLYVLEPGEAD
jgi:hypothetical protein